AFWSLSMDVFPAIYDLNIQWDIRGRFIRSFESLFRELYAARCGADLGHLNQGQSGLNTSSYMWCYFDCWSPLTYPLTRHPFDSAFLASMRSILAIDHLACQESALHGLGHWHHAHPAEVESIIDEFLRRERAIPEALRKYAGYARC